MRPSRTSPLSGWLLGTLAGVLLGGLSPAARAYVTEGPRWPSNAAVVIHLELGPTNRVLSDGFASWDESAADALRAWNPYLGDGVQLQAVPASSAAVADGNGTNTASYAPSVFGRAFGADVLAVTVLSTTDDESAFTEVDVLFNTAWTWDSYRGPLQTDPATRRPIIDFHRVAIHEFGHILGLDHPDEGYQTVTAVMNSHVSDVDAVQADDVSGVRTVYRTIGRLVRRFDLKASRLLADPVRQRLYATLPKDNALAVINAETLEVVASFFIGSEPVDLAISADHQRLYVANRGSTTAGIGVVDLNTLQTLDSLPTPEAVWSVAAGLGGRLYVATVANTPGRIYQLDAATGTVQATVDTAFYESGLLRTGPDRTVLFSGSLGFGTLKSFDVATAVATPRQKTSQAGDNGNGLTVSHLGRYLCYPCGAGNLGRVLRPYTTALFSTADLNAYFGVFSTGAYPGAVAFSPDDGFIYQAGKGADVQVFDTNTFTLTDSFSLLNEFGRNRGYLADINDLAVTNNTTGYLFVANTGRSVGTAPNSEALRVYATASDLVDPGRGRPAVAVAGSGPGRGGFVVSRVGGRPDVEVFVTYHVGGSAAGGGDYETLPGGVTIPAGQGETLIPVTLLPGANRNHKVKVFLDPGPGEDYAIGKAQSKVFLSDLP